MLVHGIGTILFESLQICLELFCILCRSNTPVPMKFKTKNEEFN